MHLKQSIGFHWCTTCRATNDLSGIGSGLKFKGIGTARYKLAGKIELFIGNTLYVPDCPSRLLCPQQLLEQLNIGFHIDKHEGKQQRLLVNNSK
jgi:hypothetical protein